MELKWHGRCAVLVLILTVMTAEVNSARPETVLLNVLAKPFVPRKGASLKCLHDSAIYLKELEKYTPWALQMYDASVKIPAGLITGNYKQLGNFDECLQVKNEHGFAGQACHAALQFTIAADDGAPHEFDLGDLLVNVAIASNATKWTSGVTVVYTWMWCVPSTCYHSEIQETLENALDQLNVKGRVNMIINVTKESCYTMKSTFSRSNYDLADWWYTSILILFALIIIISTGYDIATERRFITSNKKVIFTSFSLYTNGKSLLETNRPRSSIRCLDGLRCLSMCWIIYGHTHYMEVVSVKMDLAQVPKMHHDWSTMLVLNGNIVTDTFFLLSGILLAYTALLKKERNTNWNFNVISFYAHRYIRLTPAYAMMIGFYATLFYKFSIGPQWDAWINSNKNICRENWWTNLLYINNFVNVENMCMSQSWYLSVEMQLFWLSPLVLYPMLKFGRFVFAVIFGFALFLSVLIPFVITYAHKLTGTMLYYKEQMDVTQVYLEIYTKVYSRFGPYIIGLGLGYLLHKTRSHNVKLSVWSVISGWIIATIAGLLVVFGPRNMYFDDHVYDRLEASFYAGFHRQIFVLTISWIIFCCMHEYAGPVNHFLSWQGWVPFRKLTYCAYLSHYVFLLSNVGSVRTVGILTSMSVVRTFFANLVFTIVLSIVWTMCFEMPFMIIDRTLFSGRKQKLSNNDNFVKTGKEIYELRKKTSIACDNNNIEAFGVTHYGVTENVEVIRQSRKNDIDNVLLRANEETDRASGEVYVINTTNCNDLRLDTSSDNRKIGDVSINFHKDKQTRRSINEKVLRSTNDPRQPISVEGTKLTRALRSSI